MNNNQPQFWSDDYLFPLLPCPRNNRVWENSPSLWPTISSETYTLMCVLPVCTRNVWPTNSGEIVERRAQVFIGSFLRSASSFSILAIKPASMYGPFFSERDMFIPAISSYLSGQFTQSTTLIFTCSKLQLSITDRLTSSNDCIPGWLTRISCPSALGQLTSWANRMSSPGPTTFTTTHRVCDGIHC